MAIKKKYPKGTPKQHGSGNIYLDAALEALQQARDEDSSLSYLVLIHDEEKHGMEMNGSISTLAHSLSSMAKQNKDVEKLINIASFDLKMADVKLKRSLLEVLDNSERLLEQYIEELKEKKKGI